MTITMTWPWATHLRDAASDSGDSYFSAWVLWWDFHATFHSPLHLFDANIFFPYKDTLAFSEHLYGVALPLFPAFALGAQPLTVHTLATLLGFTLSGFGAFRLTRTLTGSTGAAWIAGIGFAFVPYRFHHLPHIGYLSAGWIPLVLEALVLFARNRSRGRAAWFGFAFLMNALSSIHWFVLTSIPLLLAVIVLVRTEHLLRDRDFWRRGAIALGAAGIVLLPFLIPYVRVTKTNHFVRTAEECASYSARLRDWVTVDARNNFWRGLNAEFRSDELCLFPGILLLILPAVALAGAAFAGRAMSRERAAAVSFGLAFTVVPFLGSFGMNLPFHRLLFEWVPLFRSIRVPARWAMVCDCGLALLAGVGALFLAEWGGRRSRSAGRVVLATLAIAIFFELRTTPLYSVHGEVDPDEISIALRGRNMSGGILELPMGPDVPRYVLRAADHGKPIISAYSGFEPILSRELKASFDKRPISDALMTTLESIPASYVVLHESLLEPDERAVIHAWVQDALRSGRLRFLGRFGRHTRDDLYAVTRVEPAAGPALPLPFDAIPETAGSSVPAPREDGSLPGSVDGPLDRARISGPLAVHGWARLPGEDLRVRILIDGEERRALSFARTPRPDVRAVIPSMGDTTHGTGFEAVFPFLPRDDGTHELKVLFESADGRRRHFSKSRFDWTP